MEVPPELAEKYEVLGILGQGGMGVVYRCVQRVLERSVALKLLHPEQVSPEFVERFKQEARLASQLLHTNVVVVFDFGFAGRTPYIAFELVEGQSVRDMLQGGVPPIEHAIAIISQACEGLSAAHARGIVHRDLKPENLLITKDGVVKVADFGIAKDQTREGLTQTGVMLGTPSYMSPEQTRESKVGASSDIYSLGIVFYELLAGRVPFKGQTMLDTLRMHAENPPPPLPQVPSALRTLITKALAKSPNDRFKSAAAFREELDHVAQVLGLEVSNRQKTLLRGFPAEPSRGRVGGPSGTLMTKAGGAAQTQADLRAPAPQRGAATGVQHNQTVSTGAVQRDSGTLHGTPRRDVTGVLPASLAEALVPSPNQEGTSIGVFLTVIAAIGLGAFFLVPRGSGPLPMPLASATSRDGITMGFGRQLRASSLASIALTRRADKVRSEVLAPLCMARDSDTGRLVENFRGSETDAITAQFSSALHLLLVGLEESARTNFNQGAALEAPNGQVPAAWLIMNATLETLVLHHLEAPAALTTAAEDQEARRGSPLRSLLRGVALLKRGGYDGAGRSFLEFGGQALGRTMPMDGVWDRTLGVDPGSASAAWFWLGVSQILAAEKAPDPQAALRNAAGSLARYLSGLPELPCGAQARQLLAQLEAQGLSPKGATYPQGSEPGPLGTTAQRLVSTAAGVIDRFGGRRGSAIPTR